jgi:hypothetical protein
MAYIFLKKPIRQGMGLIGPDQPWTKETAGKMIGTETRACPTPSYARQIIRTSWERPVRPLTKEAQGGGTTTSTGIFYTDSFLTGRFKEAAKVGQGRQREWCYKKDPSFCAAGEIEVPDRMDYDVGAESAPAGCTSENGF